MKYEKSEMIGFLQNALKQGETVIIGQFKTHKILNDGTYELEHYTLDTENSGDGMYLVNTKLDHVSIEKPSSFDLMMSVERVIAERKFKVSTKAIHGPYRNKLSFIMDLETKSQV